MSRKPKKCRQCASLFMPYNSIDKFCSPKCAFASVTIKGPIKKPIAKYEAPHSNKVFDKNKAEYKAEMIDEHGYLYCEHCGRSGLSYDTHHLIFRSEKPNHKYLHSKRNLYLLCTLTCHRLFHAKKGIRNNIVVRHE